MTRNSFMYRMLIFFVTFAQPRSPQSSWNYVLKWFQIHKHLLLRILRTRRSLGAVTRCLIKALALFGGRGGWLLGQRPCCVANVKTPMLVSERTQLRICQQWTGILYIHSSPNRHRLIKVCQQFDKLFHKQCHHLSIQSIYNT